MNSPRLTIDPGKIEHNARTLVALCRDHGIEVGGVTKGVCGQPEVARAMLRGGVTALCDSRLENIHRLQAAGIDTYYVLLRVPALSAVDAVVDTVDCSLNSELAVLRALSDAAVSRGVVHEVILMVDLGDLREGIWPDDVIAVVRQVLALQAIRIKGIGTNLSCFGGVVPDAANMNQLADLARAVERQFNLQLQWLSGVNSSGLEMIVAGAMPPAINHARLGESILLGRETIHRRPWAGTHQDAFTLYAEVVELKTKPSVPVGERAEDAFGHHPEFEDRGMIVRALLNIGREDVDVEGMAPLDPRIRILGASSGYLVADVSSVKGAIAVGNEVAFSLNYAALVAAMTSEYVGKHLLPGRGE